MRKLLAIMTIILITACTSAHADIVYLTDSGALGRVRTSGSTSADLLGTQYTTSWADPLLGSYWTGSNTRVILVDRTTDTATSGDTALIFDPADLTSPIESTRKILAGVYFAQVMAGSNNGRAIFFASGTSIYEFSTANFSLTRSYTYKPKTSEDITAEITGLISGSNLIYALVQQDISRDIVLEFDGQLKENTSSFYNRPLDFKTSAISWLSNARVAVGHEYGVDELRDKRGFRYMLSTDVPVMAVCEDSGSGFYFIEQSESEDTYITTLKHYSSGKVSTLFTNTEGRICKFVRDGDNGIMAAIVGDDLLVYRMRSDTLLGKYDSSELGGLPEQIAASAVKGDDGSSNSGCSFSGMGAVMLILAGVSVFRKS